MNDSQSATRASSPRTALVVGGAGALGGAIAAELANRGWAVAIADRRPQRAAEVALQIRDQGRNADAYELQVTEPESWTSLCKALRQRFSQLDLFVSAAGILEVNDFECTALPRHAEIVAVNLQGTINGCHTLLPWLKSNPSGSYMVLVASCAGFLTMPWSGSYNASKAGVLALGETLAAELAPAIGVTVACPAFFPSELFAEAQIQDPALARLVSKLVGNSALTAAGVAKKICDAVDRRRPYVVMPRRTHWLWWCKRLFPARFIRMLGRDGRRYRARSQAAVDRQQNEPNPQDR